MDYTATWTQIFISIAGGYNHKHVPAELAGPRHSELFFHPTSRRLQCPVTRHLKRHKYPELQTSKAITVLPINRTIIPLAPATGDKKSSDTLVPQDVISPSTKP